MWERLFLAPEGRHVYRRRDKYKLKPQRGGMWERETGGVIREGGGTVFLTHYGLFLSSGVLPPIANNGDCCWLPGDQDKALSTGDWDISRIVCASDCSEFAVIRNDDYSDDPADPFEREQIAHTHYS